MSTFLDKPVLGIYTSIYLEPEAQQLYRDIIGLEDFEIQIFYQSLQNVTMFPLQSLHSITPGGSLGGFKRIWKAYFLKESPFLYNYCPEMLLNEVQRWQVQLLQICFDANTLDLLTIFDQFSIPLIILIENDAKATLFKQVYERSKTPISCLFKQSTFFLVRTQEVKDMLIAQGCPQHKIQITGPFNEELEEDRADYFNRLSTFYADLLS